MIKREDVNFILNKGFIGLLIWGVMIEYIRMRFEKCGGILCGQ